jgi:hypothetical protein
LTFQVISTMTMSPKAPDLMYSAAFMIAGRGAALGSDLDDLAGLVDGGAELAGVFHGVRGGLLDVGVAAGVDGFNAVQGVLEVGGGDEDGIDIFAGVELVVVADRIDGDCR